MTFKNVIILHKAGEKNFKKGITNYFYVLSELKHMSTLSFRIEIFVENNLNRPISRFSTDHKNIIIDNNICSFLMVKTPTSTTAAAAATTTKFIQTFFQGNNILIDPT